MGHRDTTLEYTRSYVNFIGKGFSWQCLHFATSAKKWLDDAGLDDAWWCMVVVFVCLGGGWGRLWGRRWAGRRPHSPQRPPLCSVLVVRKLRSPQSYLATLLFIVLTTAHNPRLTTTIFCSHNTSVRTWQTTRLQSVAEWDWTTSTRTRQEITMNAQVITRDERSSTKGSIGFQEITIYRRLLNLMK